MTEDIQNRSRMIAILMNVQLVLTVVAIVLLICVLVAIHNLPQAPIDILDEPTAVVTTPETEAIPDPTDCTSAPEIETIPIVTEPEETIPVETEPVDIIVESVKNEVNPVNGMSGLEMLACVIYQEAGGNNNCDECRRRVADVALNRVMDHQFPTTLYGVLTQKRQYGNFSETGVVWPSRYKNPGEQHAVERAWRIAEEVLNGQHSELYGEGYVWQASFRQSNDNVFCCVHYYGR